MHIGYARTSTVEQEAGLAAQIRDLKAIGCERIYSEQVSSVASKRPELDEALRFARDGDVLVVTKLDRFVRSMSDLVRLTDVLKGRGVSLRILDMNLDTSTPTGELMLGVMASVAQFERSMMLERQREGIAAAKEAGKYRGRKPTARVRADEVKALKAEGLSMAKIAARLGIGVGSVHRALQAEEQAPA